MKLCVHLRTLNIITWQYCRYKTVTVLTYEVPVDVRQFKLKPQKNFVWALDGNRTCNFSLPVTRSNHWATVSQIASEDYKNVLNSQSSDNQWDLLTIELPRPRGQLRVNNGALIPLMEIPVWWPNLVASVGLFLRVAYMYHYIYTVRCAVQWIKHKRNMFIAYVHAMVDIKCSIGLIWEGQFVPYVKCPFRIAFTWILSYDNYCESTF